MKVNRYCLTTIIFLLFSNMLLAQSSYITLFDKEGYTVNHNLQVKPIIFVNNGNIDITNRNIHMTYPMNRLQKITVNRDSDSKTLYDIEICDGFINSFSNEFYLPNLTICYSRYFYDETWQSLYLPFEVSYEEFSGQFDIAAINNIRQFDDDEDGFFDRMELEVKLIKDGRIHANCPYVIRAKHQGDNMLTLSSRDLFPSSERSVECSSTELKFTFTGSYNSIDSLHSKNYFYVQSGAIQRATDDKESLNPFRWYLTIKNKDGENVRKSSSIFIKESDVSSIDNLNIHDNDQIHSIYNLSGIKKTSPSKGVCVFKMKDGSIKKIIVK